MPEDFGSSAPTPASIEDELETMRREIDALKTASSSTTKPWWYQNISAIISVLALLFSFGTTFVSYKHTESQDVQNLRQELRGLLQRLAALPRENLDLNIRYKGDPATITAASSLLNQENMLLARQAAQIAQKLPRGSVTATEYYSIASALQSAYNLKQAEQFFEEANEHASDFNDEVGALRSIGSLEFIEGRPQDGRAAYQKALNIFYKYQGYDPGTIATTKVWTEIAWSSSERSIGQMDLARQHIADAQNDLTGLLPGPNTEFLKSAVTQAQGQLESGAPLTAPAQPTSISASPAPH